MNDTDLIILFDRLRRNEKGGMTDMYAMASPHLYGIIFRILPNRAQASDVLKSVFLKIWNDRHHDIYKRSDILTVLRAQTHRAAIEYKLAAQFSMQAAPSSDVSRLEARPDIPGKLAALPERDLTLLKQAYLDAMPLDALSAKYGASASETSARLTTLITSLLEDAS